MAEPDHDTFLPTEAAVDAVLYEFKGDAREAIRALLHDFAVLAGDYEADVSRGFVRGGIPKIMIRRTCWRGDLLRRPAVRPNEDGELCPDEAIECHSPSVAAARARAVVAGRAGAVAFSRTGDPDVGDLADAVIIATVGEVSADLDAATGA